MAVLDDEPCKLPGTDELTGWEGHPVAIRVVARELGSPGKNLPLTYSSFIPVDVRSGAPISSALLSMTDAIDKARALNKLAMKARSDDSHPHKKLLWFHGFKRDTAKDIIDVIKNGIKPSPPEKSGTRYNEETLGIEEPSSYAYLGTTTEMFGDCAVAMNLEPLDGTISPFDTGGLVKHISPVNSWPPDEKGQYLKQYSWHASAILLCLESYPSSLIAEYLNGSRPKHRGPHAVWGGERQANIWHDGSNGWQAWTWEMRVPAVLPVDGRLIKWTCSPEMFADIADYALNSPHETSWYESLFQKYIPGGPSHLLVETRRLQESA